MGDGVVGQGGGDWSSLDGDKNTLGEAAREAEEQRHDWNEH